MLYASGAKGKSRTLSRICESRLKPLFSQRDGTGIQQVAIQSRRAGKGITGSSSLFAMMHRPRARRIGLFSRHAGGRQPGAWRAVKRPSRVAGTRWSWTDANQWQLRPPTDRVGCPTTRIGRSDTCSCGDLPRNCDSSVKVNREWDNVLATGCHGVRKPRSQSIVTPEPSRSIGERPDNLHRPPLRGGARVRLSEAHDGMFNRAPLQTEKRNPYPFVPGHPLQLNRWQSGTKIERFAEHAKTRVTVPNNAQRHESTPRFC